MLAWLLTISSSILAGIASHAIVTRLFPRGNAVLLFIASGGLVGIALTVWTIAAYGFFDIRTFSLILVYAAFCELYLFLFTLALSSVSANILVRLHDGSIPLQSLDAMYDSKHMVEQRVARMRRTRLLIEKNGYATTTEKGRLIILVYRSLRRFFRHT